MIQRALLTVILTGCWMTSMAGPAGRPRLPLEGPWRVQWLPAADSPAGGDWAPRPTNLPGRVTFPEDGRHAAVVFERELEIPADWAGRRVALSIGHPLYGTAIEVNGRDAGEIPGYGGQADITDLARPGESNTIRLRFFLRGGGLRTLDAYARATIPHLRSHDQRGAGVFNESFYLESQPETAMVTDVWYRTFTRGQRRLEPQITIVCAAPLSDLRLTVRIYEAETDTEVLTREFTLPPLPAGESVHTLMVPARNLTLWWPGAPHLYRGQVTLAAADGTELDVSEPTLFGVREVWTQGRHFYANGEPIHLPLKGWGVSMEDALDSGATMTKYKHGQVGTAITHNDRHKLAEADRLGMVLLTYGVSVGHAGGDLTNPEVFAAYRRWAEAHLRRRRNHPSAFFWALSTNFAGGSHSPLIFGRSANLRFHHPSAILASMVHRELDPTRPNYHHAGVGVGDFDSINFYANHLPRQAVEDWLSAWEEHGDRPFMKVEFLGVPLHVDYLRHQANHPLVSYVTEYTARLAGDTAYAAETDAYREYANYRVPRLARHWGFEPFGYSRLAADQVCEGMVWTTRAHRFRKVPTDQWIWPPNEKRYPDPEDPRRRQQQRLFDTAMELHAPLQCWIGGPEHDWTSKDHAFFAGEIIEKSLLIIDDRPARGVARFGVVWEAAFADTGEVAAAGDTRPDGDLVATLYARLKAPIRFTAPTVETPRDLVLTARLMEARGERVHGEDRTTITIYPPMPAPPTTPPLALVDPIGDTDTWLRASGVETRSDVPGEDAGGVLVIGRDALRHLEELPFTPAAIERGLRVVVFEQRTSGIERFGFRYEAHNPRHVFPRQPTHPLAAGLHAARLHNWRGAATLVPWGPERDGPGHSRRTVHWSNRGTVASNILETPHFGPFRTILDAEFDLAYTPLLQWRHGRGEVIFCQLDITARSQTEPVAEIFKQNILHYLAAAPAGPDAERVAVSPAEALRELAASHGYATAEWPARLDPNAHLALLPGDAPLPADVTAFIAAGGDVLVLGAGPELLATGPAAGLRLEAAERHRLDPATADHPLLAGVGPQHLHWREPLSLNLLRGENANAALLLDGLLGVVSHGRGRLVLFQLTEEALRDTTAVRAADPVTEPALTEAWHLKNRARSCWQANRARALLLANLGLSSSDELLDGFFAPRRPLPFQAIDKWTYLGPLPPPATDDADPVELDLDAILDDREADKQFQLADGRQLSWYVPTDVNNGLGMGGYMNLAPVYGVKPRQRTVAVTHIWSSEARRATLQLGADWWFRVAVNGAEVFRTGTIKGFHGATFSQGFAFTVRADLKEGWNEIVCVLGSGSNGNGFWFQVSDPGDVYVEPSLAKPTQKPWLFLRFARGPGTRRLTGQELADAEEAEPNFSLYSEPLSVHDDPYLYMFW